MEVQARKEKATLEIFDVQNSLNQVVNPLLAQEDNILRKDQSQETFLGGDSPKPLLQQSSSTSLYAATP